MVAGSKFPRFPEKHDSSKVLSQTEWAAFMKYFGGKSPCLRKDDYKGFFRSCLFAGIRMSGRLRIGCILNFLKFVFRISTRSDNFEDSRDSTDQRFKFLSSRVVVTLKNYDGNYCFTSPFCPVS